MGDLFFGQDRVEMADIIPRAVGVRQGCTEEPVHMITYPTASPGEGIGSAVCLHLINTLHNVLKFKNMRKKILHHLQNPARVFLVHNDVI